MARGTVKPRNMANDMVVRMRKAAADYWEENKSTLDVTDVEKAKGLVWAHVMTAFNDLSGNHKKRSRSDET